MFEARGVCTGCLGSCSPAALSASAADAKCRLTACAGEGSSRGVDLGGTTVRSPSPAMSCRVILVQSLGRFSCFIDSCHGKSKR